MSMAFENSLHSELLPILHVLLANQAPTSGVVLDLACGSGEKLPLIRAACGPAAHVIALDSDVQAVRRISPTNAAPLVGNALALPLHDASCDRVYCIAALSLFADQALALRELRRVLKPGGQALLVTATQLWAQVTRWPDDLRHTLSAAYARSAPLAAHADLADGLEPALCAAGFRHVTRAFLLAADTVLLAELALLDWQRLQPHVAPQLTPAERERCDQSAATAEIELCDVVLAAWLS